MKRIEVYKTDVDDESIAKEILEEIYHRDPESEPSFDLEDCDNVLRIKYSNTEMDKSEISKILGNHGYRMEVLS